MGKLTTAQRIPRVFIIILNWNGLHDTIECLESVDALDYSAKSVVVVDNGSRDGSPEAIRVRFPSLTLLENRTNLGYAEGNNVGMRYAVEHGADYIWLLNNDTIVERDSLGELVAAAEARPAIGLASPLVYYYDDPERLQFQGVVVRLSDHTFVRLNDRAEMEYRNREGSLVLYGTALFVRVSVVRAIGYLDSRYFAYREDYDYSLRSLEAGFHNVVVPASKVYHKGGRSLGEDSPVKYFLMIRNLYPLWMTRLRGCARAAYRVRYLSQALRAATECRKDGHLESADACFNGAWSALLGRYGEYDPDVRCPRVLKRIVSWHPYFWIQFLDWQWMRVLSQAVKRIWPR